MVRVNVVPTTETSWGMADSYDLYYEEKKGAYKEDLSSFDILKMEVTKEIQIINGKKYL